MNSVPGIVRHMSNLIVRAESDVFFATNYWQNSVASSIITNAMRELSARCAIQNPPRKIIMKIVYDRGSLKQLVDNHHLVSPKEQLSKAVNLPRQEGIPNIDLQVMNYHTPLLGTYHCKYMVVDRRVAVLQSNNIQDNDNLEMMVQLEGAIVDGLYDMAMISWWKHLRPPMPTANSPADDAPIPCLQPKGRRDSCKYMTRSLGSDESSLGMAGTRTAALSGSVSMDSSWQSLHTVEVNDLNRQDSGVAAMTRPAVSSSSSGPRMMDNEDLETPNLEDNINHYDPSVKRKAVDVLAGTSQQPADIERPIFNTPSAVVPPTPVRSELQMSLRLDEVTDAYLQSGRLSLPKRFIDNPSRTPLPQHQPDDPHYDSDLASEIARVQYQLTPTTEWTGWRQWRSSSTIPKNPGYRPPAVPISSSCEWTPYIPHTPREPFPMALVNRPPHGSPDHKDVYAPQNEAWLAALRYAKKSVFFQSPTLNTDVLVPAVLAACERGVAVFLFIDLGYNDAGELLPMQGGTNEMVSHQLHTSLSEDGRRRLHYHFYVAADHVAPIRAQKKIRSCYVKLMIVDRQIGIVGNGNMDTQSWYQSAEVNVMVDSMEVCEEWIEGLRRCQATGRYGKVCDDGLWRDAEGREVEGGPGLKSGKTSWLIGLKGAIKRVQDEGDFR